MVAGRGGAADVGEAERVPQSPQHPFPPGRSVNGDQATSACHEAHSPSTRVTEMHSMQLPPFAGEVAQQTGRSDLGGWVCVFASWGCFDK